MSENQNSEQAQDSAPEGVQIQDLEPGQKVDASAVGAGVDVPQDDEAAAASAEQSDQDDDELDPLVEEGGEASGSDTLVPPPPPPPPAEHDRYDPWNPSHRRQQYHTNGFNGGRGSPARSEASNGTAAGSDFGTEKGPGDQDLSRTPGSKFERSDSSVSRKRSYGDTDADDDRLRQHDDHTKRKRRSLVDAAYG